ncbi:MAG: polysaccharide pyruvyl transferase family protein, partial [Dolichospermum sp.]
MSNSIHALLTGALHNGNMGDHALAKAFIAQHNDHCEKITILGDSHPDLISLNKSVVSVPPFAIGKRFWYGWRERNKTIKLLEKQNPNLFRTYVWVGGVIGKNIYHLRSRYEELKWQSTFCNKFIYYFGDVGAGFNEGDNVPISQKIIGKLNSINSWISVRSDEAAAILVNSGIKVPVHTGLDAVLFDRATRYGIPFKRRIDDSGAISIIVCHYRAREFIDIWQAAAASAVKLNLKVYWISLCDSEDLSLCQKLANDFQADFPQHPMEVVKGVNGEEKIAESSICVATRLHGCIFSLTSGIPTIAIPYGAKIDRLFDFLSLNEWVANP